MASWNQLLNEIEQQPDDQARIKWLITKQQEALNAISQRRGNRNVIFYASAFLQKPNAHPFSLQMTHEEINGFMSVMYAMDWSKGLTLLLHTPGGVTNAVETIVEYLTTKFQNFEVIIPTFAMSAGTMLSLASDNIIMGRQSQLGPIDPQMPISGRLVSARAIVDQFEQAKKDILGDLNLAHVWAPILQSLGPALLQEAQNALSYGETMVAKWLARRMFLKSPSPQSLADATAAYFNNASIHKSHGRRIDRNEARLQNLVVQDLEDDQTLQDHVLTSYHLVTIAFEKSPAVKVLISNYNRMWVKNQSN